MKTFAKQSLVLFVLAVFPVFGLAQMGRGGMGGGGMHGGMGAGAMGGGGMHGSMGAGGMGGGTRGNMGSGGMGNPTRMNGGQMPLSQSQMQSGAFRMLQQKTGMTATQLQQTYASSGARNFGQFVSAMVVSKNLGLDSSQVLAGMKNQSLGETLQQMGVSHDSAKTQLRNAKREIKQANKGGY